MKFSDIKLLTAFALFIATPVCMVQAKDPQLMIFNIKNSTGKPIYGNVYKTTIRGKVLDATGDNALNGVYYKAANQGCLDIKKYKSANRTSEYHYLIFATDEQALKQRVLHGKKSPQVDSKIGPQSLINLNEEINVCYEVKGSKKIQIQKIPDKKCDSCMIGLPREQSIERIEDAVQGNAEEVHGEL